MNWFAVMYADVLTFMIWFAVMYADILTFMIWFIVICDVADVRCTTYDV